MIQQCLNAPEDGAEGDEGDEDGSGEEDKHHDLNPHPQHLHSHQVQHPYDPRGPMPGPPYQPQGPPQQGPPRGMPHQMVSAPMQAPGQYGQPYHQQMMGADQYSDHAYMQHQQ